MRKAGPRRNYVVVHDIFGISCDLFPLQFDATYARTAAIEWPWADH